MPHRGRARRHLVLVALLPLLFLSCTAGPSTRPPVIVNENPPSGEENDSAHATPLPDLDTPHLTMIDWAECDEQTRDRLGDRTDSGSVRFSCARIGTTLDERLPGPGLNPVELLKAGQGPVPLAVVNDVDGEPGTLYAARLATALPDELLQTFSLIGIDRRGTGGSRAVQCIPNQARESLLGLDPVANLDPLLDAARTAGQQCALELENEQALLDSWSTASDLDELRQALGVEHLNAIGHGEGSQPLALYAARYPDRVGRFVLDGLPDPSPDLVSVLGDVAESAETALDDFATDCANRECPLDAEARTEVLALTDQLRDTPLRTDSGFTVNAPLALHAVLLGLGERDRWAALADAIAAARTGQAEPLWQFVEPLLRGTRYAPARLDGSLATRCNDTLTRLPVNQIQQVVQELNDEHPVFGSVVGQQLAWCSPWPSRSEPRSTAGADEAPPMVVVSTAVDPVTPEKGTIRAAERIPGTSRIAWQGTGHGGLHSPCVAEIVQAFLVDGQIPRDGTLCPA